MKGRTQWRTRLPQRLIGVLLSSLESGERRPIGRPGTDLRAGRLPFLRGAEFSYSQPPKKGKRMTMAKASLFRTLMMLAAAALAASVLILVSAGEPVQGTPGAKGKIAFASARAGHLDIWVMNDDGTNPVQLTNDRGDDVFPAWSPDGTRIAFSHSLVPGDPTSNEIFVMNADGTGQTRLTFNDSRDAKPNWSPDGTKIAFIHVDLQGDPPVPNREIYVMDSNGDNQINLTNDPAFDIDPAWSPDGKRIAFASDRSSALAVYTMQPNGKNLRKLTDDSLNAFAPAWSPGGDKLAFADEGCATCEESDLFVMKADGTGVTQLVDTTPENEVDPTWSPDGTRIAFARSLLTSNEKHFVSNSAEIYVVGTDGKGLTNLTKSPGSDDVHPNWSPK
jgi:TolB protein